MKKRLTNIVLILALFGYLIFIGRSDYMFSWLAHNNFCYVWAVIAVLWLFKQDICAKWLTAGSILAIFPAQVVESIGKSANWGIGVWIGMVVLFLIFGLLLQYRKWRKDHPRPEPQEKTEKEENSDE